VPLKNAALAVAIIGTAFVSRADAQERASTTARLDSILARYVVANAPGCAVGFATGRDTVTKGFGLADLEHDVPVSSSTIFEAGSISKQITAAAVVLLAIDGKLTFDDDVRKFVPELPDYGTRITIRHLLNHTSGLRDWGNVVAMAGWPRGSRVYNNRIVVDVASRQKALNYAPGTHYSYTNTGYNLLAVIVSRLSGQSFADFTRDRIFRPLGMANSSWRDDYTRIVKGRAYAYAPAGTGWRLDMPFENAHGNGGMLTTVQDLLRFTANLETGSLGGPRFIEEMHRRARLNSGKEISYASGLFITEWRGTKDVNHSGATGGYRTYLTRLPDKHIAVAVLCNGANVNPTGMANQVLDAFAGLPAVAATRMTAGDSVSVSRMLGTYRNTRVGQPVRMAWRDGRLAVGNGLLLSPDGERRFVSQNGDVVVFDAPPPAGRRGGFHVFTRDDSIRYEPVEAYVPTAANVAEYAGTYTSDEAEATVTVVADGTNIRLRDRYGSMQALLPSYRDSFAAGGTIVTFVRNAAGKVVALNVGSDRAWSVRFDKR
jgi:CubicO group peptidase (beta-lactamase class C family)